jgi:crotonobetainyl-CoA:carnitine CoA-transferase CaiB-like acyl-CoA transferase
MRDGFLEEIEHPAGMTMLLQHEPITWNGERLPLRRAPLLGEHTATVFEQLLGIEAEALAELVAEGVVY